MKIKVPINNVIFSFSPECSVCENVNPTNEGSNDVRVTIEDILDIGHPICCECDAPLPINDFCIVDIEL